MHLDSGGVAIALPDGSEVELGGYLEDLDRGAPTHPARVWGVHGVPRRVTLLQLLLGVEQRDSQNLAVVRPVKYQQADGGHTFGRTRGGLSVYLLEHPPHLFGVSTLERRHSRVHLFASSR
jgi:hypothetical protein